MREVFNYASAILSLIFFKKYMLCVFIRIAFIGQDDCNEYLEHLLFREQYKSIGAVI